MVIFLSRSEIGGTSPSEKRGVSPLPSHFRRPGIRKHKMSVSKFAKIQLFELFCDDLPDGSELITAVDDALAFEDEFSRLKIK